LFLDEVREGGISAEEVIAGDTNMLGKEAEFQKDTWKTISDIVSVILEIHRRTDLNWMDRLGDFREGSVDDELNNSALEMQHETSAYYDRLYLEYYRKPGAENTIFQDIIKAIDEKDTSNLKDLFAELLTISEEAKWGIENLLEEIEELLPVLEIGEGEILYSIKEPLLYTPAVLIPFSDDLFRSLAQNPHLLFQISPREFEEVVAEIFRRNGFDVKLTKRTRDGGKDIIAIYNKLNIETHFIIECKRWLHKKVSLGVVQRLLGVKISTGAHKAILATTSTFTKDAIDFKLSHHLWDLELKDYSDITEWLRSFS
jgi:hypothetical protein